VDLLIVVLGRSGLVDGAARVGVAPALGEGELEDAVEMGVQVADGLDRQWRESGSRRSSSSRQASMKSSTSAAAIASIVVSPKNGAKWIRISDS
jgi:hypothetical protein